jgi:hypothetical protein
MEPGEIVWEEPPPPTDRQRRRGKFAELANELRKHPKRWGRIYLGRQSTASTLAYGIRHGTRPGFREGRWEAVSRRLTEGPDGDWATHARYVGDDEPDLTEETP